MTLTGYIDAAEASRQLGVRRATLYAYVSRGLIRTVDDPSDPHRRLYRAADIERLKASKRVGRKPERAAASALDWGLPVLTSQLTLIENGRLLYRGQDATALAQTATLEEAAALLWNCGSANPFKPHAPAVGPVWSAVDHALCSQPFIERATALLPLIEDAANLTWQHDSRLLWPGAVALLRAVPAIAIGSAPSAEPAHVVLGSAWKVGASGAGLIRAALVLLADHELNASAFAVRVVASTGASLAACLVSGLGALSGPLHGGATSLVEVFFDEAARLGSARQAIKERLWRGDRLPGFEHPLYPEGDPRAQALLPLLPPDPLRSELQQAMAELGKQPTIDFALVSLRRALDLPLGAALILFAVGRTAGWLAHALEQQAEGRLIRPRARYRAA